MRHGDVFPQNISPMHPRHEVSPEVIFISCAYFRACYDYLHISIRQKKTEMSKSYVGFILRFQKSVGLVLKADVSTTSLRCDCPSSATKFGEITCFSILQIIK